VKIVLDSNVIIAAFAARGLCNALFESCIGNHDIILCEEILSEIAKNLKKKIRLPDDVIRQILLLLRSHSTLVTPQKVDIKACKDKKDLMILGSAISGNADYIITGDKDLLSVGRIKDVKIVDPRTFWGEMKRKTKYGTPNT
jgi:putative PIN family toxin of toxin-antitoxin system